MKLNNCLRTILLLTICASLVQAEVKKSYEQVGMWGDPNKIRFITETEEFENRNYYIDSWMYSCQPCVEQAKKPYRIPAEKHYTFKIKLAKCRKPESFCAQAMLFSKLSKRRLVLINPEDNSRDSMPLSVRCHPHAGLLHVATVAKQEGYEVIVWDELVQGWCNLEQLVQPGDVVGFSIVITGVKRAELLAHEAKKLGASAVVAGNDSAIFRCNQLLARPGRPFNAIFTSNSLNNWRQFLKEFNGRNINLLDIPEFKTRPGGVQHSNRRVDLVLEQTERKQLTKLSRFDKEDGFIVPDFSVYPQGYLPEVWKNFHTVYGHKHLYDADIRNALALLAQGCTRTQGVDACSYCSIYGVGDVRIPSRKLMRAILEAYHRVKITELYLVTDSAFEMTPLINTLEEIQLPFEAMTLYARAQGIVMNPQFIERWLRLTKSGRVQFNVGIDAGDEAMLLSGIGKSSVKGKGSRLAENKEVILALLGTGAHLHYSVIFGSPGESHESCKRTLEFIRWSLSLLGQQIDLVESDLYWLNFGSPSSQVFYDYSYAQGLAAKAGKNITRAEWWKHFGSRANELVVPWETERAWYTFFTNITLEDAQWYNSQVTELMLNHVGSIGGRAFFPREKEV